MMNYFNGFDTLDTKEYDEIMEDLSLTEMQDEIMAAQAADYFNNEIDKDYGEQ